MRKRRTPRAIGAVLAVAAVAVVSTACGGEESTAEAQQDLCTALGEFGTDVRELRGLTAESTVEQWEEARDAVADSWENVREQAADVEEARFDEVEAAYDELDSAIGDVPDDATVEQAVQQVAPQLAAVETAWDGYYAQLGCA